MATGSGHASAGIEGNPWLGYRFRANNAPDGLPWVVHRAERTSRVLHPKVRGEMPRVPGATQGSKEHKSHDLSAEDLSYQFEEQP